MMTSIFGLNLICATIAFSSLVYELTLAQALSATLGGTVLRYATTIGLFTFSLGVGATLHEKLPRSINTKSFLGLLQVLVAITGMLGPYLVMISDPALNTDYPRPLMEIISYSPIVIIGVLSGLELPVLMALVKTNERGLRILAFDYLGMFAGCIAFPLLLLPEFGVFRTAVFAGSLNLLSAFFLFFVKVEHDIPKPSDPLPSQKNHSALSVTGVLFLAFGLAFCSMTYELLIAKTLTELTLDEVVSQSITIGVFLLGLGAGAWQAARREHSSPLATLFRVEVALTAIGSLSVIILYVFASILQLGFGAELNSNSWWLQTGTTVLLLQPLAFTVGYLTGFELPLLMKTPALKQKGSQGLPLAASYFGSLAAGFAVPLLFVPYLGTFKGVIVTAFLNLLFAFSIIFHAGERTLRALIRRLSLLAASTLVLAFSAHYSPSVQQAFLKIFYLELSVQEFSFDSIRNLRDVLKAMGDIPRIETPYQSVDIVDSSVTEIQDLVNEFTLYLNRQPQFSQSTSATYHESFSHGAINLARRIPRKVLILGGGDGLLAAKLLEYPGIEEIDLVELDEKMIVLSRTHPSITTLNGGALENPRVKIFIGDAFTYVRTTTKKYDAVFIDFPYPVSFDLLKLFSVEFYSSVWSVLKEDGFAILDAPIWRDLDPSRVSKPEPHEILFNTITAAGFKNIFPFGPLDPFVYIEKEKRKVAFDYSLLNNKVSNRGFVNLTELNHIITGFEINPEWVNSVFRPRRFK